MTTYHVAYSWAKRTVSGFGSITIKAGSDKLTTGVLDQIKDEIAKQNGYGVSVVIINVIKLED